MMIERRAGSLVREFFRDMAIDMGDVTYPIMAAAIRLRTRRPTIIERREILEPQALLGDQVIEIDPDFVNERGQLTGEIELNGNKVKLLALRRHVTRKILFVDDDIKRRRVAPLGDLPVGTTRSYWETYGHVLRDPYAGGFTVNASQDRAARPVFEEPVPRDLKWVRLGEEKLENRRLRSQNPLVHLLIYNPALAQVVSFQARDMFEWVEAMSRLINLQCRTVGEAGGKLWGLRLLTVKEIIF